MIEVTVKTLDSQSRNYSVPDDITIQAFKAHIASSVNIIPERQRLIFQGRVLQDEEKLNVGGNINGKVIHLVERLPTPAGPPPQPQQTPRANSHMPHPGMGTPMPRVFSTGPQNIMGPFPIPGPGGNFNSGQFVQQMLQQALNGMGGRPMGPTVVRSSVRHPTAPGHDARTEIQIHIAPQGAPPPRPQVPGSGASAQLRPPVNQQGTAQHAATLAASQRQVPRPQPLISEPRRQLNYVEYLITKFEEHVKILESGNFDQARSQDGSTDTASSEPMDTQSEPSTSAEGINIETPGQSGSVNSTVRRHPTLPEVGRVMRRVTGLESRLLPFLIEYTDFLESDPAYTSTESPEYKKMMGFANAVLKAQRALSLIHRILSSIVIPLSETPPRPMLVQGECQRHRAAPPPHARRIHNVASLATAGQYLNQPPIINRPRQAGPRGPYHFRMPMVFGPFRAAGPANTRPRMMGEMPQGMFRFRPINRSGPPPHQSGLYGHPPPRPQVVPNVTSVPQQPPAVSNAPTIPALTSSVTSVTVPPQSNAPSVGNVAATNTTPNANSTLVEFSPPEYTVQVTTNIQPNININITPGPLANSTTGPQEGIDESIQVEGFTDTLLLDGGGSGENVHIDGGQDGQMFDFSGSIETDEEGNITMPMDVTNLPNIPGISQDAMRQIIQSVHGSVQQVMNVVGQGEGNDVVTGATTTQHGTERITVEGLPGGQNQIPVDIANIIGQTVQNIMMTHLNTDHQDASTQEQDTTGSTTSQSETTPSNSSAQETTTAPSPEPQNPLLGLLSQISSGQFGTLPAAASSSSRPTTSTNQTATGGSGRAFKMPTLDRTPNCVNDIVQSTATREPYSGSNNIMSLVLFISGELLSIQDTIVMMAGVSEPANRLRGPLQQAISDNWFDGNIPNEEEIEAVVDCQSDEARPSLTKLFSNQEPKSSDVSIVESNLSLLRHVIRKLLHILFLRDSQQFADNIRVHLSNSLSLVLHLNTHIMRGSEDAMIRLFTDNMDSFSILTRQDSSFTAEQLHSLVAAQILPFTRSNPMSQDQIDQFVMNEPSTVNVEQPEKDPETAPSSSMKKKNKEDTKKEAEIKQPSSESRNPVQEDVEMQEEEDKSASSQPQSSSGAVGGGDADWRTMVPQEWVSVISSDIEKQKNIPEQPAYSEAYMAGMPASKRRKV